MRFLLTCSGNRSNDARWRVVAPPCSTDSHNLTPRSDCPEASRCFFTVVMDNGCMRITPLESAGSRPRSTVLRELDRHLFMRKWKISFGALGELKIARSKRALA